VPGAACPGSERDSLLRTRSSTVRASTVDEERWRPARGYAGFYEVSDLGSVYSMPRAATAGGLLAVQLNSRGYRVVTLAKYGRTRTVMVARLVLEAFDSPAAGRRAGHGPKGRADDSLGNLSWR
jgi:hypothetical protein